MFQGYKSGHNATIEKALVDHAVLKIEDLLQLALLPYLFLRPSWMFLIDCCFQIDLSQIAGFLNHVVGPYVLARYSNKFCFSFLEIYHRMEAVDP